MPDILVQLAGNLAWDLLKVLLATAVVRAALKWLFRIALDRRQQIAFWILTPALLLAAVSILSSGAPRPDLRIEIDRLAITPPPSLPPPQPPSKPGTDILVTAEVRNLGSPSVAVGWTLTVNIGDTKVTTLPIMITGGLTFNVGEQTFKYPSTMMLYRKTAKPIPNGGREVGLLSFFIENANPSDIQRPGNTFVLSCKDVRGRTVSARLPWPAVTNGFSPVPGVEGED